MSKQPASAIRVYLDEFKISSELTATQLGVDVETPVITTFEDAGPRRVEGGYDHNASLTGLFDGDQGAYDETIQAILGDGADHFLSQLFQGNSEGDPSHDQVVRLSGQPRSGQLGGAILLNVEAQGSNGAARATVLRSATISGIGTGTGRNLGATTAGEIFAVIARVISGTFTDLQFDIQESSDDGSADAYADITGLDFTFSAAGVTRKTVTAATEAWKLVNVDAFTGTDAVVLVTAGKIQGSG